jgi:hypothetical protein
MTIKQLFNKIERANEIGSMFGDKYGIEVQDGIFFTNTYFTYNDFTKALKEDWQPWFVKGVLNKENEIEHGIGHSEKEYFMRFTYQVPWETNESIQTIYFTIVKK